MFCIYACTNIWFSLHCISFLFLVSIAAAANFLNAVMECWWSELWRTVAIHVNGQTSHHSLNSSIEKTQEN